MRCRPLRLYHRPRARTAVRITISLCEDGASGTTLRGTLQSAAIGQYAHLSVAWLAVAGRSRMHPTAGRGGHRRRGCGLRAAAHGAEGRAYAWPASAARGQTQGWGTDGIGECCHPSSTFGTGRAPGLNCTALETSACVGGPRGLQHLRTGADYTFKDWRRRVLWPLPDTYMLMLDAVSSSAYTRDDRYLMACGRGAWCC